MEKLRTSNLGSRYTSLKGFHRALHRQMEWRLYLVITWLWEIFISPVTEGLQLSNLGRKYTALIGLHRALERCYYLIIRRTNHVRLRDVHAIESPHSSTQTFKSWSTSCFYCFVNVNIKKSLNDWVYFGHTPDLNASGFYPFWFWFTITRMCFTMFSLKNIIIHLNALLK